MSEWSRLSARMLLIHPLRAARDLLPALVPLLVVGRSDDGLRSHAVDALMALLVVGGAFVRWATTRYRVDAEQVQLRHGLLKRETVTAPLDRVRTVDVEASPVHRILGLAKVHVGTGAHEHHGHALVLDGLPTADAERLRTSLLHRITRDGATPASDGERVLVGFDPRWVRYAPLSTSGLVAALVTGGFVLQMLGALHLTERAVDAVAGRVAGLGVVVACVVALGVLLLAAVLANLAGYLLGSWGHTVTRNDVGTLRITRGLLTTRSTTLEERRVRGVILREPALVRLVGGASLHGIVTGGGHGLHTATQLLPLSPRPVDIGLAGGVLGSRAPLAARLVPHGPGATRRRWSRAAQVALLVAVPDVVAARCWDWPSWGYLPAALAVLSVPVLSLDRARALGHVLTADHLVARSGSIRRDTVVVEIDGVIGWGLTQTLLQRRLGLVTLTAMTSAGHGGYRVLDLPAAEGYRIVAATQARVMGSPTPPDAATSDARVTVAV